MSFSNHADAFYHGYKRERVTASRPNAGGSSYRQPDRDRVSDMVLSGLGADDVAATTGTTTPGAPAVAVTSPSLIDALKANKLMAAGAVVGLLFVLRSIGR